jgi:hypothetical protein
MTDEQKRALAENFINERLSKGQCWSDYEEICVKTGYLAGLNARISDEKIREIAEAVTRSSYIDDHLTPDERNVFVVSWFDYLKKELG